MKLAAEDYKIELKHQKKLLMALKLHEFKLMNSIGLAIDCFFSCHQNKD